MVTKYIIQNNVKYLVDLNNLILLGDSAGIVYYYYYYYLIFYLKLNKCLIGGNLAAVISQHLIENKIAVPKLQVLIYPILQFFDFTLPSYRVIIFYFNLIIIFLSKSNFKIKDKYA